jgi:hypothetical protein
VNPNEPVGWKVIQSPWGRFLPTLGIVAAVIALGAFALAGGTSAPSAAPLPPSPLIGVVTSVDAPSLGKVNGFDLRLGDGSIVSLKVGILENATDFSPSHLSEHQATSVPVRAFYRLGNGIPVVYRLEDAGN